MYAYSNNAAPASGGGTAGGLYRYNMTDNTFTFLGNGPTVAGSDGASCRGAAPVPVGTIVGTVYQDSNGSDSYDAGTENGISAITVSVYSDNGTPTDSNDDVLIGVRETVAGGAYSFEGINASSGIAYRVEVDVTDTDLPVAVSIGTTNPVESVTVTDGGTTTVDFGFDAKDYGDAPISGTAPAGGAATNAYGEASHIVVSGLYLGAGDPDSESANQPTATADGDNSNGTDDEDGISAFPALTEGDTSYSLPIANITASGTGTLHGWIDFDGNGTFDSNEHNSVAVTNGTLALPLNWLFNDLMNAGTTFARFRFTTDTNVTNSTPSSAASDGEVEDYALTITALSAISACATNGANGPELIVNGGFEQSTSCQYRTAGLSLNSWTVTNQGTSGGCDVGFLSSACGLGIQEGNYAADLQSHSSGGNASCNIVNNIDQGLEQVVNTIAGKNYQFSVHSVTGGGRIDGGSATGVTGTWLQFYIDGVLSTGFSQTANTGYQQHTQALTAAGATTTLRLVNKNRLYSVTGVDNLSLRQCGRFDYADAIASYGSPSHEIVSGLQLGAGVTSESAGYESANADGDTDDGVSAFPVLTEGDTSYTLPATNITVIGTGTLHAWIDFDGDGAFESGEYASTTVNAGSITGGDLSWTGQTTTSAGTTFARFRFTSNTLTDNAGTAGVDERATIAASDGEVEDYPVTIATAVVTPPVASCGDPNSQQNDLLFTITNFPDVAATGVDFTYANGEELTIGVSNNQAYSSSQGASISINNRMAGGTGGYTYLQLAGLSALRNQSTTDLAVEIDVSGFGESTAVPGASTNEIINNFGALNTVHGIPDVVTVGGVATWNGTALQSNAGSTSGTATLRWNTITTVFQNRWVYGSTTNFAAYAISEIRVYGTKNCSDYSDAPITGTAPDGVSNNNYGEPHHEVVDNLYLGAAKPDIDTTSQPTTNADGDDINGTDDDDGISAFPALTAGDTSYSLPIANITASGTGVLHGWIDFDGNGVFDSDEHHSVTVTSGTLASNLSWSFTDLMVAGTTFARFRLTTDTNVTASTPSVAASDGEVEDYAITVNVPAFSCDSTLYAITGIPSIIREVGFTATGATFNNLGTASGNFNAGWGYNVLDNYIYGIRQNTRDLIRINANGSFTNLGAVPTLPEVGANAGDVLPNGELVMSLLDAGNTLQDWAVIDLTTQPYAVTRTFTLAGDAAGKIFYDVAYNPTDSLLYGVATDSSIVKIDPANGNGTLVGTTIGNMDALWFDQNGKMYGYRNVSDSHYAIDLSNGDHTLLAVSDIDDGAATDGASCRGAAPVPTGSIAGTVYADADGSDTYTAATENGLGSITVNLYFDNGTAGNLADDTLAASTESAVDGSYVFNSVNARAGNTYRVEVDTADTDLPVGVSIGTTNPIESVTVTDGGTTTVDFGFDSGFIVTGRVYKDTNVDGVNNDTDGVSGLPVVLLDVNANTCVSTRTNAQGNYAFSAVQAGDYQLYEASRESVPTPRNCGVANAKDPKGYRSTTDNVLAQFSVVDADITDKDFGDVQEPLLTPDNTGSILPNNVVFYSHQFKVSSTGSVNFTGANTGNIATGWSSVLYQDVNCNNSLDGVEGNAPIAANLPTVAGQTICLINKVYAPASVADGESYSNVISADFNFNNNAIAGTTILTVTDLTKAAANDTDPEVGTSRLELRKTVENITQGTAETEAQNQAKSGDVLKYRIYYSNTGTGVLTDLIINDEVPAFTTINGMPVCEVPLPASLSNCTPSVDGSAIKWTFPVTDELQGGASGVVSYEVMVD